MAVALLLTCVFGGVGLLLFGIGTSLAMRARTPNDAMPVSGEVVSFSSYHRKGRTMYSPRYRVTLPNGSTVVTGAASMTSKSWKSPPLGTIVTLSYSPHDTETPLRETGLGRFLAPMILCGIGSVFALVSLGSLASSVISLITSR